MTNERHEKALEAADWIEHDGSEMPVDEETFVEIKCRNEALWRKLFGFAAPSRAGSLRWDHKGSGGDILYYRLADTNHFTNGE